MLVPKKCCVQQEFWVPKMSGLKRIWNQNFVGHKILQELTFLGPKNSLYSKSFWTQNALENGV